MSVLGHDDREAVRALRAEWDHAVPSAGGPSPYASWLEREVVRSRRQASGAVDLLRAIVQVDDDDPLAVRTERMKRVIQKARTHLGGQ